MAVFHADEICGTPRASLLPHFVIAVSSDVVARAAFLIRPRDRARGIAEPVANIAVGATTAGYWPPATAILQRIIPSRLILERHPSVRVAQAVPLIEIVAVAARRRTAVTAVADFLDQRIACVQLGRRRTQLQRERRDGDACEHSVTPPFRNSPARVGT